MNKWIRAARCRTLPLSLSAVITGVAVGLFRQSSEELGYPLVCGIIFILLTAVLLQILSNYANDYGDQLSGVDNTPRVGRISLVSSGGMTMQDLKKGILVLAAGCAVSGLIAIVGCFWNSWGDFVLFVILGILAMIAAVGYTLGPAFSYLGLGDLFVFLFFGLTSVMGSEYMIAHNFSFYGILLGVNAGATSVMVLNVNNLRDYESDIIGGKRSLVVRLGLKFGRRYHLALWILSFVLSLVFSIHLGCSASSFWPATIAPVLLPLAMTTFYVINPRNGGSGLEPAMKRTSLSASLINIWAAVLLLVTG